MLTPALPPGARKMRYPGFEEPMLATLAREPFNGPEWLFEVKWDGYRALACIRKKHTTGLYSRAGRLFTKFTAIIHELNTFAMDAILDGEIVAFDKKGRSSFQVLQNFERKTVVLNYYVFDILYYNGYDLTQVPLIERKRFLEQILPGSSLIKYSEHCLGMGDTMYAEALEKGLEGIMAKKCDSPYEIGERSDDWQKIKIMKTQEGIIVGFTDPKGSRKYLGTLLLAAYVDGQLKFIGSSGGGFTKVQLKNMYDLLKPIETQNPPVNTDNVPRRNPIHWVKPKYVCECSFSEWTEDMTMRHPVFRGLRPDKKPRQVVIEQQP